MESFSNLLIEIGKFELELEKIRLFLCGLKTFELYQSFNRIDRIGKGYLTSLDIRKFLRDNSVFITQDEASLYVMHYDSTGHTQKLVYKDFVRSILPLTDGKLRT